jgi:hypothetical protein
MTTTRTLEQLADRMIAAEEPGYTPRDLDVAASVETYVSTLPSHLQKDIHQLLWLFEYLPPLIIFKLSTFTKLAPSDQSRYIDAWGTSRFGLLRTGFRVLKNLCVSAYYQNPVSWKAIGYDA